MILPATNNLHPIIIGTTYGPVNLAIIVDGVVKDLTGCVVELVIHKEDDVMVTLTTSNGLVVDARNGIVSILLSFSQVSAYLEDHYNYYLNITETDGTTIYRYSEGNVEVRE